MKLLYFHWIPKENTDSCGVSLNLGGHPGTVTGTMSWRRHPAGAIQQFWQTIPHLCTKPIGHQLIHLTLLVSLQDNMYELLGGLLLPNCLQSPHFREWWRDTHYLSPRDLIDEWIRIVIGRGAPITVDNFRASSEEGLHSKTLPIPTSLDWAHHLLA